MKYLIKIVLLNSLFLGCALSSLGATTFQQTITTTCPAAVDVTAINPSAAMGTIAPATGNCSSPSASFQLKTNGIDANYTYVVQAKLLTTGGVQTNAYAQVASQPYILLGNNAFPMYPTVAAVTNITSGTPTAANNTNVIAYPITNTLNNLASATFTNNALYGGLCYIIKTGASQNGTFTQTLGAAPLANTYSFSNDKAGTYQAVVTFTANRNP